MRGVVRVLLMALVAFGGMKRPAGADPDDDGRSLIRVACIGDSITAGAGVMDRRLEAYPSQLDNMLGDDHEVRNFGVSGATMLNKGDRPYQEQKACRSALDFNPDVVVIMLGTNDTKPQNWRHKDEFAADARGLIDRFAALPSKPRIFLAHPVPVARPNFGINDAGVKEEQPIIDSVAAEAGATVIDLYGPLADRPEFFPDGVHPNAAGASIIAKGVFRALTGRDYDGPLPPAPKAAGRARTASP